MGEQLEARLKDIEGNPSKKEGEGIVTLKSELQKAEEEDDQALAKDLARTRAQTTIGERKLRLKQINDQLGGTTSPTTTATPAQSGGKRWSVIDGKPVEDPDGEYETFAQAYKVAALEAAKKADPTTFIKFLKEEGLLAGSGAGAKTSEGSNFTQELATRYLDLLDARIKGAESDGETQVLRQELSLLREEIKRLSDPIAIANRARELTEGLRAAGLIPEATQGTTLEQLQETHRHEEKMEEIKVDKDYKQTLGQAVQSIPESLARGIGAEIRERGARKPVQHGQGSEPAQSELQNFTCTTPGCGTTLHVPPGATRITCGKCKQVYGAPGTFEPGEVAAESPE